MYKNCLLFFALLCSLVQCASTLPPLFEIKPSYFFFCTSPMRTIYNHGGFEIQGSASGSVSDYCDLYGSIGYRKAEGHALNSGDKTSLTVIPIDIGLKPTFNFCKYFYYFFTIGPRCFYFRQRNNSPYVDHIINGGGVGLFVNTGFNLQPTDDLLLGIFGEYSYEKKKICSKKPNVYSNGAIQMGGFAFGVSLGYEF